MNDNSNIVKFPSERIIEAAEERFRNLLPRENFPEVGKARPYYCDVPRIDLTEDIVDEMMDRADDLYELASELIKQASQIMFERRK